MKVTLCLTRLGHLKLGHAKTRLYESKVFLQLHRFSTIVSGFKVSISSIKVRPKLLILVKMKVALSALNSNPRVASLGSMVSKGQIEFINLAFLFMT